MGRSKRIFLGFVSALFLSTFLVSALLANITLAEAPPLDNNGYVLAAGDRTSVTAETTENNTTNNNGTEWYYRPSYSMGFAPAGASVELNTADTTNDLATEPYRVSWHMDGYNMVDGWRAGLETGVHNDGIRYIYQSNSIPSYYPSGPQTGVDPDTVTDGGWTLCYSGAYNETVDTVDLFTNTCTGSYLMYAATLAPHNYFDITMDGETILQDLGDGEAEWPVYTAKTLNMQLYQNDRITQVEWDDYIVFRTVDCSPQSCFPNDPVGSPEQWNSGVSVTTGQYLVDEEDTGQWLAVYQADDTTGEIVPGTDSIFMRVDPAPVDLTINTCEELQGIDDLISSQYATTTLEGDIDCEGQEFEPLFQDESFQGTIDGNGYTIKNIEINQPEDESVALISRTTRVATVRDLHLENVQVTGGYEVAGLIASVDGGLQITDVYAQNVYIVSTQEGYAGGLFGDVDIEDGFDSLIQDIGVDGSVSSSGNYSSNVGGMFGLLEAQSTKLVVERAYANVDVTNVGTYEGELDGQVWSDVGGFAGEIESDDDYDGGDEASIILRDVYAWGNVSAENSENVGGLVGRLDAEEYVDDIDSFVNIQRAYARGSVTGFGEVGGLIGQVDAVDSEEGTYYTIASSFAMGRVTQTDEDIETGEGGLIGQFEEEVSDMLVSTNNYFDQTRSGLNSCNSFVTVTDCTAVNTDGSQADYFINNATSAPLNDWDFEGVWVVNEDVPPTFAEYELGEDLNGDMIADEDQPNVGGYVSNITGKIVAIDVGEGCELTVDDMTQEQNFDVQDAAYNYENGLWAFEADCETPGFTTTIALYYYGVSPDGLVARKHNPVTGAYFTLDDAAISETTINGQTVTVVSYQITDGGDRDVDALENGEIVDPVGIGALVVNAPNTGLGGGR